MGSCKRYEIVAALTSLLVALPSSGRAELRDEAAAEAMFLQGRQAMESGNYREACAKFAESERLDPAAGTLMNLATCEERGGRLASAWQHWKEAIDALPGSDQRVAFARARVDDLEKKLPRLSVTAAPGTDPAARVLRDDVELGPASLGVPLPVDPGEHSVTVRAPGRTAGRTTISLAEGEQRQIEVHQGAPDAPVRAGRSGGSLRTLGWVAGGLGVAGVTTAAVTGILLVQAKNTADANCPNKVCLNQAGLDAAAAGKTLLVVNAAGAVAGVAGLGVGAYLILSSPPDRSKPAAVQAFGLGSAAITWAGTF